MNEKVDIYFKLLHPEYKGLSEEEQKRALSDKTFIKENLDKMELMYQNACSNGISPEEAIRGAVNIIKVNKYRDILYSDEMDFVQETEFSEEQQQAYDKRQQKLKEKINFIREHIDEIDKYYQECINGENKAKYEGMTEQQILQETIESVNKKISVNTPTTDNKKEDVVRNEEMSSDEKETNLEEIMPVDESKFAEIYGKAKGRIKEVFSKIKSFLNVKSNDRSDKTNDETIK